MRPAPPVEPRVEAVFRNGSVTAFSVVIGFSLSFLNRWAGLPGPWDRTDFLAVALIVIGIALQVVVLAQSLSLQSLVLANYQRTVRLFIVGLVMVVAGIAIAITVDILGVPSNVLRG